MKTEPFVIGMIFFVVGFFTFIFNKKIISRRGKRKPSNLTEKQDYWNVTLRAVGVMVLGLILLIHSLFC